MTPQKLTLDQMDEIWKLSAQHPKTYYRGQWYPATMAGKPVEIRRTQSAGQPYLGIRKQITVHLKDPQGNVIDSHQEWKYFTVNLHSGTLTVQGW